MFYLSENDRIKLGRPLNGKRQSLSNNCLNDYVSSRQYNFNQFHFRLGSCINTLHGICKTLMIYYSKLFHSSCRSQVSYNYISGTKKILIFHILATENQNLSTPFLRLIDDSGLYFSYICSLTY